MPDAKSLLPGRAFRSEHAQLRPEPHSIASHGPAPMDPLQTTRMRNGVLYAAEWPCCHDPLRLSLGSEDPFSQPTRSARAVAHPPLGGCAPAARAECVRLPRARGGVRPTPPSLSPPPLSPCLRARCPLAAGASKAPSAHASRVGGRAASLLFPTARVCASCPPPTGPQRRRAGLPLLASPLLLPTASVCASCPPRPNHPATPRHGKARVPCMPATLSADREQRRAQRPPLAPPPPTTPDSTPHLARAAAAAHAHALHTPPACALAPSRALALSLAPCHAAAARRITRARRAPTTDENPNPNPNPNPLSTPMNSILRTDRPTGRIDFGTELK